MKRPFKTCTNDMLSGMLAAYLEVARHCDTMLFKLAEESKAREPKPSKTAIKPARRHK